MIKTRHILSAVLCSVLLLSSCGQEKPVRADGQICLSVSTASEMVGTKAYPDSEDALRENQINSIDYFIYGSADQSTPVYSGHLDTDAIHQKEFIIDVSGAELDALFGNGTPFMYAVVNLPASTNIPSTASLDEVMNAVVEADFLPEDPQVGFVMSGQKQLVRPRGAASATCDIEVSRVAAKISFDISIDCTDDYFLEDPTDPESSKWFPHPEAMRVQFLNLSSKAVVMGGPSLVAESEGAGFSFSALEELRSHYYTYPRSWDFGERTEPYLFITIPVTKDSFTSVDRRDCYYKIVFTNHSYESNSWYHYDISLQLLGSFEAEVPTVPTPDDAVFFVYRWGGKNSHPGVGTDAQITGFRYLEVGEKTASLSYSMHNVNVLEIPFKSSHHCVILNKTATSPNFNSDSTPMGTFNRASDVDIQIVGETIRITHVLNNDISSGRGYTSSNTGGYDYAPITVNFTIQHETDDHVQDLLNKANITVTQYPALSIEAQENSVGGTYGGAFVNADTGSTDYGNLNGASGGKNSTTRMYVVTSSVLSGNQVLGDPRSRTVNNLSVYQESAQAIEGGGSRYMTYYYPTDASSTTKNMIAPAFRIASSYGKTSSLNYKNAQRRCATYQEDGYPMGRWRLPTKAEVEFINKLSTDELFPRLFSEDTDYWCAHGYVNDGVVTETTTGSCYVRCVYDEWYWANSAYPRLASGNRNTAYWGDALR